MLRNLVGNQLITILRAIYRYVYHLGYDNMNTFVNDAADTANLFFSGPLYILFEVTQTLINTHWVFLSFNGSYYFIKLLMGALDYCNNSSGRNY